MLVVALVALVFGRRDIIGGMVAFPLSLVTTSPIRPIDFNVEADISSVQDEASEVKTTVVHHIGVSPESLLNSATLSFASLSAVSRPFIESRH